jgi:hypothetical protein
VCIRLRSHRECKLLNLVCLAPVGALGLDDALGADQPVRRTREPVCVLVHVQAGRLDEVARVRAVPLLHPSLLEQQSICNP